MDNSLIIVDVFTDIASKMNVELDKKDIEVTFVYGKSIQILNRLQQISNDPSKTKKKYPLFALFMPFPEQMGGDYYATVVFPKIVFAVAANSTDAPELRYNKSFRNILYPIYEEFKNQIVRSPYIVIENPDYIPHKKLDNPGSPPPDEKGKQFNDYVDAIEIYNIELTFQKNNSC